MTSQAPTSQDPPFFTMVDVLQFRAQQYLDRCVYTFLVDGETHEINLSFKDLALQARAVGAFLQSVTTKGEHVLLLYPPGLDYIIAFFACLYAGVVAVPTYPPQSVRSDRSLPRIRAISNDAHVKTALTTFPMLGHTKPLFERIPEFRDLHWIATDTISPDMAAYWQNPRIEGEDVAFLQYTSGSTGTPKGVMVTHANLLDNQRLMQMAHNITNQSVFVSWLPLYHDMGLIGNILLPLYAGARAILMAPVAFLQRPFRWLGAISRYRATISGGPNFAYDLCVRKVSVEQRESLDLSSWEDAFNGAEPVRQETMEQFAETFAVCGFRYNAFSPDYGLAEATLFVAGGNVSLPRSCFIDDIALSGQHVTIRSRTDTGTKALVGYRTGGMNQKIIIVDPETAQECEADQIGEVWVAGSSRAQGYWGRVDETTYTFQACLADTGEGPFLRTGDLGFLYNGDLYITGRLKDLIIIRGRNIYPQDIELTVEQSHEALRAAGGAAFSVEVAHEERLIIVHEVERQYLHLALHNVIDEVRQVVSKRHEVQPYAIILIKTGTLPKTSSGKIQRHLVRTRYLAGDLEVVGEQHA